MTTGTRTTGTTGIAAALFLLAMGAGPAPALADLFGRDAADAGEAAPPPEADAEPAFSAESLAEALPRTWRGTFAWDQGVAYYVEAEIVSVVIRDNGEVGFTAETQWLPDGLKARLSGRIDPGSLAVRIREVADDASAGDFDSDGRYDGTFAADLWDLRARWITDATGETGNLVLIAESRPDPPE